MYMKHVNDWYITALSHILPFIAPTGFNEMSKQNITYGDYIKCSV